jgi:hypothetical protein
MAGHQETTHAVHSAGILWGRRHVACGLSNAYSEQLMDSFKISGLPSVGGMRHTSTALYFCGASKKSLQKPRTTSGNGLFHISYSFNYYLQLLCLQLLSKTHLNC